MQLNLNPGRNPLHFAVVAASTPGPFPATEQFDTDRWPAEWIESRPYDDQRQHVVMYAAAYPNKYPRASTGVMYSRFKNPSCVLFMAEAVGVDKMTLRRGTVAMLEIARNGRGNMSLEAAAFRRIVPWAEILRLVPAWLDRTEVHPELIQELTTPTVLTT